MLEWRTIEIPDEALKFTAAAYEVYEDAEVIFQCGLKDYDLIQRRIYLWLRPFNLTHKHLRGMHRLLHNFDGMTVFVNIMRSEKAEARFARFFGFVEVARQGDVILYERTA